MEKEALAKLDVELRAGWEAVIDELGPDGLERPGATGRWRVRDVLAHLNGWDRWQTVQLRCAFTGEVPTDAELTGGIQYPANDDMSEDAMNAMFEAGTRGLPLEKVVSSWREVCDMRSSWIAAASQDQLDALIGQDWQGGSQRIFRLVAEVPSASNPEPVWQRLVDQLGHTREHLSIVEEWIGR